MVATKSSIGVKRRKGIGPGRSELWQAAEARGRQSHNLWCQYSSRLGRDVVSGGDLAFAHFCWLEGDPHVSSYELKPSPVTVAIGYDTFAIQCDALVKKRHGQPELHVVDTGRKLNEDAIREAQALERAAAHAGLSTLRITTELLAPHRQLIANWRCGLAFLSSCRTVNLKPYADDIEKRCQGMRQWTIGELLVSTNPAEEPQYYAAVLSLLQTDRFRSDLDQKPLCASSLIWEARHG
jgi:hypothetical protein